jgi:hypothetical protein
MKTKFITLVAVALFGLFLTNTANAQISSGGNGIQFPTKQFTIKAYPNPAIDELNIELNMPKELYSDVIVEIMTPQGQKVYQFSCSDCVDKSIHVVNVKDYAPGMYHVRVSYQNTVRATKFIKIS